MARFIAAKYVMKYNGKCEYVGVIFNNKYGWFDANSTDEAIEKLHGIMKNTTYILKIQTETGYKPFYKAVKNKDGTIKVLNDTRYKSP